MTIAIIDYGMGNLRNVQKALEKLGYSAVITEDKEIIRKADKVVLPGVGAFGEAMKRLKETGLDEAIRETVAEHKPLLGICLGMQLLFEQSAENGLQEGLGVLHGKIVKLNVPYKIPHMGSGEQAFCLCTYNCLYHNIVYLQEIIGVKLGINISLDIFRTVTVGYNEYF